VCVLVLEDDFRAEINFDLRNELTCLEFSTGDWEKFFFTALILGSSIFKLINEKKLRYGIVIITFVV